MAKVTKSKQPSIRELRSINIALDIDHPERLLGYVATQKSVSLAKDIFAAFTGDTSSRAFSIAAPYGSGKSSAGLLWCLLAESGGKLPPEISPILEPFRKPQGNAANPIIKMACSGRHSIAIPLSGYDGNVSEQVRSGLISALERNGLNTISNKVKKLPKGLDGLLEGFRLLSDSTQNKGGPTSTLIVWDEFGKVLEHCAATGDSKALYEIQSIAEFVSRSCQTFPIVLTLLLHQSFARYASGLPNYVRTEWSKIEGRFRQINYIEDSKEVYQLIAQIVSAQAPSNRMQGANFNSLAKRCHQIGIFKDFDTAELAEVLKLAAPLTPVALYILPKISARVAQNERTLFTFIHSDEPNSLKSKTTGSITPAQIYDFFSEIMRLDTNAGGSHRNWVETNVALRKASDLTQSEIIKALAAMKLASAQKAIPGNEDALVLAFGDDSANNQEQIRAGIKSLLDSKAIFHRRISNDYSVWQGSDVDIRTAVDELKAKLDGTFDLSEFLNQEHRPPYQRPQRYNDTHAINRYFDGCFISPSELNRVAAESVLGSGSIRDGRIYYVLAETQTELKTCRKIAEEFSHPQIVIALPKKALTVRDTVCELKAYYQLLSDPEFCGQDPIIEQELKQLVDETETFLRAQIEHLTLPSSNGPSYYYQRETQTNLSSTGQLRKWLSKICENVFPKTPRFNNEMINRSEPSAQIVNARKKLLRAMLLSTGTEGLSLEGYGPEVAIFRAIFLNSSVYAKTDGGTWAFNEPTLKGSKALKEVWRLLLDYWTTPSAEPKNTHQLISTLLAPPFGLREGVLPLLFAAVLKSTHSTATILEDGVYVRELKAETFERLIRSPRAFVISVPVLEDGLDTHLSQVISLFKAPEAEINNPVRRAVEGIMKWARALPPVSIQKGVNSSNADELIDLLMTAVDPLKLMTKDLVRVAGNRGYEETLSWLKARKTELEKTEAKMLAACKEQLFRSVGAMPQGGLAEALRQWKSMLPGDDESYLGDRVLAGFLTRIDQQYATETELLLSLASHFTGKSLRYWDRTNLPQFELSLLQTVKRIEDIADRLDIEAASLSKSDRISIPWTERRLKIQIQALTDRLGAKKTKQLLQSLIAES